MFPTPFIFFATIQVEDKRAVKGRPSTYDSLVKARRLKAKQAKANQALLYSHDLADPWEEIGYIEAKNIFHGRWLISPPLPPPVTMLSTGLTLQTSTTNKASFSSSSSHSSRPSSGKRRSKEQSKKQRHGPLPPVLASEGQALAWSKFDNMDSPYAAAEQARQARKWFNYTCCFYAAGSNAELFKYKKGGKNGPFPYYPGFLEEAPPSSSSSSSHKSSKKGSDSSSGKSHKSSKRGAGKSGSKKSKGKKSGKKSNKGSSTSEPGGSGSGKRKDHGGTMNKNSHKKTKAS